LHENLSLAGWLHQHAFSPHNTISSTMKIAILASLLAATTGFVPTKNSAVVGRHIGSLYRNMSAPRTFFVGVKKTDMSADENPSVEEVDFKSIYEIESVNEMKLMELRKAGIHLTNAMRTLQVDYEQDLATLDSQMKTLDSQKESKKLEKAYVKLAYELMKRYTRTGDLVLTFHRDRDELYQQVYTLFEGGSFENDLFDTCLAKYGMYYMGHKRVYSEAKVTLGLLPESPSASD
jgi:hypothetical protein